VHFHKFFIQSTFYFTARSFTPDTLSMKIRLLKGRDIPKVQRLNHLTLPENYTLEFLSIHYLLNPSTNYVAVQNDMLIGIPTSRQKRHDHKSERRQSVS
ncbi:Subunit of the major N alpha-acetyltransferase, partial [Trachipleistophora hominis]